MEELKQFLSEINRDGLAAMTNKVLYIVQEELFRNQPKKEDIHDLAEMCLSDCEDLREVISEPDFEYDVLILEKIIDLLDDIIEDTEGTDEDE